MVEEAGEAQGSTKRHLEPASGAQPLKISLLAHFLSLIYAQFLTVPQHYYLCFFGILGAALVCQFCFLTEQFRQYAIRRTCFRTLFAPYLRDVKLKASVELHGDQYGFNTARNTKKIWKEQGLSKGHDKVR